VAGFAERVSRRGVLGLLAATAGGRVTKAAPEPPFVEMPKALWVWRDRVLSDDGLTDFAGHHGFTTLFVYVSPAAADALLRGDQHAVTMLQRLRSGSKRVFATAGEPDWTDEPSALPLHVDLLLRLRAKGLVDGVHLDVEPHSMPQWKDGAERPRLIDGTIKFFETVRRNAGTTVIDAAVNPIFATTPAGEGTFLSRLVTQVDSISIMAYRRPPARAIAWAEPSIRTAAQAARIWRFGVLADDDPQEPGIDWSRVPAPTFTKTMVDLDQDLRRRFSSDHYAGLAFHAFDGLRSLIGD